MIIHNGDMWEYPADLYFVTTNSFVRKDGSLVMGRGAAKEAANRVPELPFEYGRTIQHLGVYGIAYIPAFTVGLFQVKRHWKDDAILELIEISSIHLKWFAKTIKGIIALNYPGIGNGRLKEIDVYPIIQQLPDNVIVCKK